MCSNRERVEPDAPGDRAARHTVGDPPCVARRWRALQDSSFAARGAAERRNELRDGGRAYFYLGVTNGAAGRYDEAVAMHRKARDIAPEFPGVREALGCAWALGGHREKALALLRESEAQRRATYVSGVTIGCLYAATGDTDAALDSIERAIEERDPMLVWLKFMPAARLALGRIRTEPRFRTLVGRLGLG